MTTAPSSGSPERDAWPFLVAPGIRRGVRVVVAPDFLHADADAVFGAARTGPGVGDRGPTLLSVRAGSGELLTLLFRHTPVMAEEVDVVVTGELAEELGPAPLYDAYSRPIVVIEGFVLRGEYTRFAVGDDQWQELHENVLFGYRRLLEDESEATTPVLSERIRLTAVAAPMQMPARDEQSPDGDRRPRRTGFTVLGAGVALVIATVLLIALLGH